MRSRSLPNVAHLLASLLWMMTFAALLSLTACSPPKSKDQALADPLSPTAYPQIATLDGLGSFIAFSSPAISTSGGDELIVTVPIRLTQGEARGIEYKFEFFKEDGSPVTPTQPWQYMNLPFATQRYVTGRARTTQSKEWRLLMRPVKE